MDKRRMTSVSTAVTELRRISATGQRLPREIRQSAENKVEGFGVYTKADRNFDCRR